MGLQKEGMLRRNLFVDGRDKCGGALGPLLEGELQDLLGVYGLVVFVAELAAVEPRSGSVLGAVLLVGVAPTSASLRPGGKGARVRGVGVLGVIDPEPHHEGVGMSEGRQQRSQQHNQLDGSHSRKRRSCNDCPI